MDIHLAIFYIHTVHSCHHNRAISADIGTNTLSINTLISNGANGGLPGGIPVCMYVCMYE